MSERWHVWSEEGQTRSGSHKTSICNQQVGDEGPHECIGQAYGATPEESRDRALKMAAAPTLYAELERLVLVLETLEASLAARGWTIERRIDLDRARTALRAARGEK